jgi:N-methylhydantoinase B
MKSYADRWQSHRDGYLHPGELEIDPSLHLHTEVAELDAITYEVLRSRLWSINLDHQDAVKRTSGSGVVIYAEDLQAAILTEDGDGAVAGPGVLVFAGTGDPAVKWTLEYRSGTVGIGPGDIFIHNDPWVGTNHQMDVCVYAPVFVDEKLFCWVYNSVHQQEVGGLEPGGFVQQATDTFAEAVAVPPIKLVEAGRPREDLLDSWARRSRLPDVCRLELQSQLAGVEFARERIHEAIAEYRPAAIKGTMRRMIDSAERAVAARLQELPDGIWRDRRYIGGANPGDRNTYRLELALTKTGSKMVFCNEGTDPSVGSFNITAPVMRASILVAALPLLAYDQYLCGAGVMRCIEFQPALGTITAARHPAACGTSYGMTTAYNQAQYLINKMIGTVPAQRRNMVGASAHHTQITTNMFGVNEDGDMYSNFPFDGVGGGTGAFSFRDGVQHGGSILGPMLRIGNVEEWEREIPFLYLYRAELAGGGGHGRWRGGTGIVIGRMGYRSAESFISSGGLYQSVTQGQGLSGGLPGSGGRMWSAEDTLIQDRLAAGDLPSSPEELREMAPHGGLPQAKIFNNRLSETDVFEVVPQLGAGHGDPLLRDYEHVQRDYARGQVSVEDAARIYGVVLVDGEVDEAASDELRAEVPRQRLGRATPPLQPGAALGAGTVLLGHALETVGIAERDGEQHLVCASCHHGLAPVLGDYRQGVAVLDERLTDIDPGLFVDPLDQVDHDLLLRRYLCPGCGLGLDADIVRPDDPLFQDVQLTSRARGVALVSSSA